MGEYNFSIQRKCNIMKESHAYLIPDYYPHFACKMGSCRTACCEGWPITVSMQDYFHLLGVDCSPELRRRLDCSMHLLEHPSQEAYAQINPRYDGNCPMRLEDGRCAIHAELGDSSLSAVCRLYPRGPRAEGDYECSCANSCEAVIELLFSRTAPLTFQTMPLEFDLPQPTGRTVFFETVGREQEIRLHFIRQIQDRSLPMPQRIMKLGLVLKSFEEALNERAAEKIDLLLQETPVEIPELDTEIKQKYLESGLRTAKQMLEILDGRSDSIRAYGEASLTYFGCGKDALDRYFAARNGFEENFPNWQIWFEHMLANHMFFVRFPFQDRPESMYDEFIAICAVYTLLRFLSLGWMADKSDPAALVDVCAAAFRLIDHTDFDRYAAHLLKRLNYSAPLQLYDLIRL